MSVERRVSEHNNKTHNTLKSLTYNWAWLSI